MLASSTQNCLSLSRSVSIQKSGLDKYIYFTSDFGGKVHHDQRAQEHFASIVYSIIIEHAGPIVQEPLRVVPQPELLNFMENITYNDELIFKNLVEQYRNNPEVQAYWKANGFSENNTRPQQSDQ